MISVRAVQLATFLNYLASCSTDSSTVHRFDLFGYFNGSKIFNLGLVYDYRKMPPFFETINIADPILVLKFGQQFLICVGQRPDSTCQILSQYERPYSQSVSSVSLAWRLDREMRRPLILHETGFIR